MVTPKQGEPATPSPQQSSTGHDLDPTDTEHAVGDEQAAENADEESPS
jgi:hypothetical protein